MQVMVNGGDMGGGVRQMGVSSDWVSTVGGSCDVESDLTSRFQHFKCHLDIFR